MSHSPSPTNYDEIPYDSHAFPQTHPDRLAMVARLFGVAAPEIAQARVLELGCGNGENLIPMAEQLPAAQFMGTDLSGRQIEMGRTLIRDVGLTNIDLQVADILAMGEGYGRFDYILCHGVYSWVPAAVQERILEICRRSLQPNGVAFISYNTYPGWHQRGALRDMLLCHTRQFEDPREQIAQGRAFMEFLAQSVFDPTSPYGKMLAELVANLRDEADSYFFHEYLEEANQPLYFREFAARAAAQGLEYVGDSYLASGCPPHLAPETRANLERVTPDYIAWEQYLDFLRNRMFRNSLLTHAGTAVRRVPSLDALRAFYFAAPVRPVAPQPDVSSDAVEQFRGPSGTTLSTNNPLVKTILVYLGELWPHGASFETLWDYARQRLGGTVNAAADGPLGDWRRLAEPLLQAAVAATVEIRTGEPRCVRELTARPVASRVARVQAGRQNTACNLLHRQIPLTDGHRALLPLLDGTRDRAALAAEMAALVADGRLRIGQGNPPSTDPAACRQAVEENVSEALQWLYRNAVLIG